MKTGEGAPQDADKNLSEHPELGLSIYDNHNDCAGVACGSRLRRMLKFRPFHFNWLSKAYRHFAADLYLLDWLKHNGFVYNVLTDEDLYLEGLSVPT